LSPRRDKPLVQVNCAALPETLAEGELFGHVRGAFSGATHDRPGRIEAAHGGTLVLDEVGELPLTVQAKLLRALQNGEIQRLGADRPRRVDVRIVAATNRDLAAMVRSGHFRADLYHRLSVFPLPIPPLRVRGTDVLLLAGQFLERHRARLGLRSLRLAADAEPALLRAPWPGNVRELEHAIGRAALRAAARADRTEIVTIDAAALGLDEAEPVALASPLALPAPAGTATAGLAAVAGPTLRDAAEAAQRACIHQALLDTGANWSAAARRLGVDASNLHKLALRLGIKPSPRGG